MALPGSPVAARLALGRPTRVASALVPVVGPNRLIIDDLGHLPFDQRAAHLLLQLVVRRSEKSATLITTNQMVTRWGAVFGNEMNAAAMLDRPLRPSRSLVIEGDSDRMSEKRKAGLWTPPTDGKSPPGEQRQRPTRGVNCAGVWGVNFGGA